MQGVRAQSIGPSTLNAAGGSGTTAGTNHDWNIGEMTVVSTEVTPQIVVTQGLLQPEGGPNSIGRSPFLDQHLSLYPNPTQAVLHLQPTFGKGGALHCTLADAAGRMVLAHRAKLSTGAERQTLNLGAIAAGTYTLTVAFDAAGSALQTATYKVQKIQ